MKKSAIIFCFAAIIVASYAHSALGQEFKAEQFSRSAEIVLSGDIESVFPLFGAMEEKKWSPEWNPTPLFPASGEISEGFIFKTPGHVHGENYMTWVVATYDTTNHEIQYIITASNRVIILKIKCIAISEKITKANISYKMTGLDQDGNKISQHTLSYLFAENLKDWEKAINDYLKKKER